MLLLQLMPIILLLSNVIQDSYSTKLNGGLAFTENDENGQIYVNLNRQLVVRTADTSIINQICALSMDITNQHYAHCQAIKAILNLHNTNQSFYNMMEQQDPSTLEVIISPIAVHLMESPEVCKSLGANLPEIKTIDDREFIVR